MLQHDIRPVLPAPPTRWHSGQTDLRVQAIPEQPQQRAMQVNRLCSERSSACPAFHRHIGDSQLQAGRNNTPAKESSRPLPHSRAIEARFQTEQKFRFATQSNGFTVAFFPTDAFNEVQQAQCAPRHAFGIRHAITADPMPQILGFPNVEDDFGRPVHEINARFLRQLAKEFAPQPFDKRLGVRPKTLLSGLHAMRGCEYHTVDNRGSIY